MKKGKVERQVIAMQKAKSVDEQDMEEKTHGVTMHTHSYFPTPLHLNNAINTNKLHR